MDAQDGRASGGQDDCTGEPFTPAYLHLPPGALEERAAEARRRLAACTLCPRRCGVNRLAHPAAGFCRTGARARVTDLFAHPGEEGCLSGTRGSGTIFFGSCNLGCRFCQNWEISRGPAGREFSAVELAEGMLALQSRGCHNLNFVTPTHVLPAVLEALALAAPQGLAVPLVWNTSGYEERAALELLAGLVDLYLPDFKFWNPETAARLAGAPDYPEKAREAVLEMHRQTGLLRLGPEGLARRGVLVRHLIMPGLEKESEAILRWLAEELSSAVAVNILDQYQPAYQVGWPGAAGAMSLSEYERRPTRGEREAVRAAARAAGLWRLL